MVTANEFLTNNFDYITDKRDVEIAMVEFAKLHVEAALKAAAENVETKLIPYTDDEEVDKSTILGAYPLSNIKYSK